MKFESTYEAYLAGRQAREKELMSKPFLELAEEMCNQLEALERRYVDLHSEDIETIEAYAIDDYTAVVEAFQKAREALQVVINVTDTGDHILNPLNREFYHLPSEGDEKNA